MILAELWVKFLGDATDLQQKTAAARKDIEKFGQDMQNVGQRLAIAVSLPLMAAGLAVAKVAGEMEQNAVAFTTLLKSADAAKAHMEGLQAFALKTPFQFPELVRASRLMQAYGFSAGEVIPKLRLIGDAVSALGGGSDLLERMVRSLGEISTNAKITGEQIRELSRAGIPVREILAKALGVSIPEAMKKVEAGVYNSKMALDALFGYMNTRFKGGMEAQAQTLLGMWSNVRDAITFTLNDVGKAMLPMGKDVINNYIFPLLEKVKELAKEFSTLPPVIQKTTVAITALAAIAPAAIWGLGSLAITGTALMKFLIPLTANIMTVTYAVRAGLTGALVGAELALVKFGLAAGVIVGLALAAKEVYRFSLQLADLGVWSLKAAGGLIPFKKELADTWEWLKKTTAGTWIIKVVTEIPKAIPSAIATGFTRGMGPAGALGGVNDFLEMWRSGEGAEAALQAVSGKLRKARFQSLAEDIDTITRKTAQAVDDMRAKTVELDKAWKTVGLKDLRTELKETEAAYAALRRAGVLSGGDIVEVEKKLLDLRQQIADRTVGTTVRELAGRAWEKSIDGIKAATDAIIQFNLHGSVFGKQLELHTQEWDAGATAAYQYSLSIRAAYDQMKYGAFPAFPKVEQLDVDWSKVRGTSLEAIRDPGSAVSLRRAATLAGDEWQRMIDLQKTGARTAVDVKLAYEKWVDAEERAIGLTDKHKRSMSGFKQAAVSAAREISTAFSDMGRAISEIIWPRGGTTEPAWLTNQKKAADALKAAYEGLAARGYNDPKKALEEIISRIKGAGTAAEANAIAIKNFGSAGVEMARMIRDGSLSTEQFAEALKVATGEMVKLSAETQSKAKGIASVFEEVARAVLRSILTIIIEQGLLKLMKVLGMVKKDVNTLEGAFQKVIERIGGVLAGWLGLSKKIAETAVPATTTAAQTAGGVGAGAGAGAGAGGAAGGGATAATGVMGLINVVSGVVSAVSNVISNFQQYGMNKSLDIIVKHTLQTANDLANLRADQWARHSSLFLKLDDLWSAIRDVTSAIRSGGGYSGGGSINTYNITVNAPSSDARAIVDAIKSYVSTRSPVFA